MKEPGFYETGFGRIVSILIVGVVVTVFTKLLTWGNRREKEKAEAWLKARREKEEAEKE